MARKILRTKDVAAMTGIPVGTLSWYRHIGVGPRSFILGRRTVAYYEDDVQAWLDQAYESTNPVSA